MRMRRFSVRGKALPPVTGEGFCLRTLEVRSDARPVGAVFL
jgi:hypothetical protein